MDVSAIMSTDLVTVGPEYNVADVACFMLQHAIGSVIVLEGERVLGILTERDILRVVGGGDDPKQVAAHEALSDDLITIEPSTGIDEAAQIMTDARVRHLPVVSDEGLIGIVSIRDLVRWSAQQEQASAGEGRHRTIELSRQVLSLVHPVEG